MLGKSYNRGIRAHKLAMEALFRLLLKAFVEWLKGQTEQCPLDIQLLARTIEDCQNAVMNHPFNSQCLEALENEMSAFSLLLARFKKEGKEKSHLFAFWEEYITMVLALLQFIKAERTSD